MSDENKKVSLRDYRLLEAKEKLAASRVLLESSCYKDSINRSYYAIFNAMRSVLAMDEVDFKRHGQVIGYFNKNYIHTGKFDTKYIGVIGTAFQIRNSCDYDDFYIASRKDAEQQCNAAEAFVSAVEGFFQS